MNLKDIGIPDSTIQNKLDENRAKNPEFAAKSKPVLDGPTHLYRHFDEDGNLLYVGISLSATQRLRGHRDQSHWFDRIALITVHKYSSRQNAMIAEDVAIAVEKPLFNIKTSLAPDHNVFDPEEEKVYIEKILRAAVKKMREAREARLERMRKD